MKKAGPFAVLQALLALGLGGCNSAAMPASAPPPPDNAPDTRLVGNWKWSAVPSYIVFREDGSGTTYSARLRGAGFDSARFAWSASGGVLDLAWKRNGFEDRSEKASYRFISNDVVDLKIPSAFWGSATRIAAIPR